MKRASGFTLIELLVVMTILGILSAIAIPAYSKYVLRTRLGEAFTALAGMQPVAEQYWADHRSFADFDGVPADSAYFTYSLTDASASAYTVTATGRGATNGFVFTIDQGGRRATTGVPEGWTTNANCWVDREEGTCVQ